MHPGETRAGSSSRGPSLGTLEASLEPDESIWAVVPGAGGEALVATDRRLFHLQPMADRNVRIRAWRFETLDEIRPIGGRPGETAGRFRVESARPAGGERSAPLVTFAIDPGRRDAAMQAVTIVQLLIARARRHIPIGQEETLHRAVEAAMARARDRRADRAPANERREGLPPHSR